MFPVQKKHRGLGHTRVVSRDVTNKLSLCVIHHAERRHTRRSRRFRFARAEQLEHAESTTRIPSRELLVHAQKVLCRNGHRVRAFSQVHLVLDRHELVQHDTVRDNERMLSADHR